jgi:DNA-binding NtrC family response regulator
MSSIDKRIRESIESFVDELSTMVRQAAVEAVQEALAVPAVPARRGAARWGRAGPTSARARHTTRRAKRSPNALAEVEAALLEEITVSPGRRIEVIGKSLGIPTKELNLPIKKLLATRKIRKKGEKRATEYYVR